MKFLWDEKNKLKFQVYLKPGQRLKYLNKGSTHQRSCGRLDRLTTKTDENKNMRLDEIYPLVER